MRDFSWLNPSTKLNGNHSCWGIFEVALVTPLGKSDRSYVQFIIFLELNTHKGCSLLWHMTAVVTQHRMVNKLNKRMVSVYVRLWVLSFAACFSNSMALHLIRQPACPGDASLYCHRILSQPELLTPKYLKKRPS